MTPNGNYEPFTVLAGLVLVIIEIIRRNLGKEGNEDTRDFEFKVGEETVTYEVLVRSLSYDLVKVNAYTHMVGIAAERAWINYHYPESEVLTQAITDVEMISGFESDNLKGIPLDLLVIRIKDGRTKKVYFDITSFLGGGVSSSVDPQEKFVQTLKGVYCDDKNS